MFARRFKRFVSDQGMLLVLLLLCAYFSWRTWTEQQPAGETAARQLLAQIASAGADHTVLVVAGDAESDREFAMAFSKAAGAWTTIGTVTRNPHVLTVLPGRWPRRALLAGVPTEFRLFTVEPHT